MSESEDRAAWTRDAIERTRPNPKDGDLGYDGIGLSISTHLSQEIEYTVFQDPNNPQSYLRMDTKFVYDIGIAASHEATSVRREYE